MATHNNNNIMIYGDERAGSGRSGGLTRVCVCVCFIHIIQFYIQTHTYTHTYTYLMLSSQQITKLNNHGRGCHLAVIDMYKH